jgi:hypothetical protein
MRQPGTIAVGRKSPKVESKRTWKQRLREWLNRDDNEEQIQEHYYEVAPLMSTPSIDNDRGIHFKVFKASGGTIIETSFYDRQKDRQHNSLHVITDDKDIGKELGKIITMETLKI